MNTETSLSDKPLIAIVDDDASVRRSTLRLLRWSGMRSEGFASAEDVLQSGLLGQIALLLLDVRMSGMDGLDLQRRLIEMGCPIPIVFLSAPATAEEESQAMRGGAIAFLRKPVRKDDLLRTIQRALNSNNP